MIFLFNFVFIFITLKANYKYVFKMRFLKPVLVSSVIAGLALLCSCKPCNCNNKCASNVSNDSNAVAMAAVASATTGGIVYMDVDTVLQNYNLAKELTDQLKAKQDKSAGSLQSKQSKLQQEMANYQKEAAQFQQDYQNGKFLTQVSIQEAQQKLLKKEQELMKQDQDLQALNQKLTKEMLDEQEKMNKRLRDSLNSVLAMYQKENRYKMILSNNAGDNVIWADSSLNITKIVTDDLNARYPKKDK